MIARGPSQSGRSVKGLAAGLSALFFIVLLLMAFGYSLAFHLQTGAEEPIPFSHRVHAGNKKISCVFCHDTALTEASAGIPTLQTCMLCHTRVAVHFPPIAHLRAQYYARKPVLWQRTRWADDDTFFPDFVYFTHSMHLNRSIDCAHCHGPVDAMDRIVRVQDLNMGFCIRCHKHYNATHDCFTCHR